MSQLHAANSANAVGLVMHQNEFSEAQLPRFAAQQMLTGSHRPPAVGLLSLHIPARHTSARASDWAMDSAHVHTAGRPPIPMDAHPRLTSVPLLTAKVTASHNKMREWVLQISWQGHTHPGRKGRLSSLPTQSSLVSRIGSPQGLTTPGAPCRCPAAAGRSRSCR
jgi:hypothetical protein